MLRLHSVINSGFGKETGLISFLYSHLLNLYGLDYFNLLIVNHIGLDLEERIFYDREKIHINIRYPINDNFLFGSAHQKNVISLDIIHNALLRLSIEDARLDPNKIKEIRKEILNKNFLFEIEYMTIPNIVDEGLVATILLRPYMDKFDFFCELPLRIKSNGRH